MSYERNIGDVKKRERESNRNLKAIFKREVKEGLSENMTLESQVQE